MTIEAKKVTGAYDAYVFDLDGTLLDTLDDLTLAVNAAMKSVGFAERSKEEVRRFVGNGIKNLIFRATGLYGKKEVSDAEEKAFLAAFDFFKTFYAAHLTDRTAPYAGILPLLGRLRAEGKKIAVVSNKADFATQSLCKTYFEGLVDVAAGENEEKGIKKKPAPDSVFRALEILGVKNAVYIGDSEVDIQTAKNAGLPCVSVCWGFKDEAFLLENGAKILVKDPSEIF